MLFTDIPAFWLFLLLAVGISLVTRNSIVANKFALIAISFVFFALYAPRDAGLFIVMVLANYGFLALADKARDPRRRRHWAGGLAFLNVGVLLYFKYYDFLFLGLASEAGLGWLSPNAGRPYFELMAYTSVADSVWVPLALSFYTFHIISYCVDVLTGKSRLAPFADYLLYLCFFPHLLAGPIVRGGQLIPQIQTAPEKRPIDWSGALYLYIVGLFFKVAVADPSGALSDRIGMLQIQCQERRPTSGSLPSYTVARFSRILAAIPIWRWESPNCLATSSR